jgi:dynein heavy chain
MIDPQSQANKFIKNLSRDQEEAKMGLDCCKMSDATLLRNLELAIQFGKWFLIENVGEDLDPALEPILLKQVDKSGSLRLGDKSIPWNNDFKFFLTTTIPNPHYAPET